MEGGSKKGSGEIRDLEEHSRLGLWDIDWANMDSIDFIATKSMAGRAGAFITVAYGAEVHMW